MKRGDVSYPDEAQMLEERRGNLVTRLIVTMTKVARERVVPPLLRSGSLYDDALMLFVEIAAFNAVNPDAPIDKLAMPA